MAKYLRNAGKTAIKKAVGWSKVENDRHLIRQLKTAGAVPNRSPNVTLISFPLIASVIAKVDKLLAEAVRQLQDATVSGLGPLLPPQPTAPAAPPLALPLGSALGAAAAAGLSALHPSGNRPAPQDEHVPAVLPAAVQHVLPGGPLLLAPPGPLPGLPCLAVPHAAPSAPADPPVEVGNTSLQACSHKRAAPTGRAAGHTSSSRQPRVTAGGLVAVAEAVRDHKPAACPGGGRHRKAERLSAAAAAAALRRYIYPLGRPRPKTVKAWNLTAQQQSGRYGVKRGKGPVPTAMPVSREQRAYEEWSKDAVNTDRPPEVKACSHATFQGRLGTLHRFLGVCMHEYKVPTECLSMELLSNPVGHGWGVRSLNQPPHCSPALVTVLEGQSLVCRVSVAPACTWLTDSPYDSCPWPPPVCVPLFPSQSLVAGFLSFMLGRSGSAQKMRNTFVHLKQGIKYLKACSPTAAADPAKVGQASCHRMPHRLKPGNCVRAAWAPLPGPGQGRSWARASAGVQGAAAPWANF